MTTCDRQSFSREEESKLGQTTERCRGERGDSSDCHVALNALFKLLTKDPFEKGLRGGDERRRCVAL